MGCAFRARGEKQRLFADLSYAAKIWDRERRVIADEALLSEIPSSGGRPTEGWLEATLPPSAVGLAAAQAGWRGHGLAAAGLPFRAGQRLEREGVEVLL